MENGFSSVFYFSCQWNVQMIWAHAKVSTWLQFRHTHSASCLRTSEVSSPVGIGPGVYSSFGEHVCCFVTTLCKLA